MPPPRMTLSALLRRDSITPILEDTLEPPTMAAKGRFGVGDGAVEVVELLLEEEAGDGRGEELSHARGGRVRAVRGAEGVVDVEVGVLGELLGEVLAVLLLVLVEADVLEEADGAVGHAVNSLLDDVADAVVKLGHGAGEDSERRAPTGVRRNLSSGPSLGRPLRCGEEEGKGGSSVSDFVATREKRKGRLFLEDAGSEKPTIRGG